ncbi:hypothetical protein NPIL_505871 [Nephila pilipes]|uniref:Uncharacterized protein n=1 Tax=Nephila pilipes TaxID=299642 RepID=A0A8X6I8G3_NEPPI|nr:hypothetical protein NPIL_505871 [Nephila pilipes]
MLFEKASFPHSPELIVWCSSIASFIFSAYFYEELRSSEPVTCSVTAQPYLHMLQTFVVPQLKQRKCFSETLFIQDEAPPLIGRAGYLKSNVYRVANLNDQKDFRTQHVRNITPDELHSAVEDVIHSLDCVLQHNSQVEPELDRHHPV